MAKSKTLADIARKFRDAFKYDPGHSDLDREQPITIRVTLGDWRDLNYALHGGEYICKCGVRVVPHKCAAGESF